MFGAEIGPRFLIAMAAHGALRVVKEKLEHFADGFAHAWVEGEPPSTESLSTVLGSRIALTLSAWIEESR